MGLKIDFLCNDGSPLRVTSKTVWGDHDQIGVGGSELSLLTMCEALTKRGHDVVLYNNPKEPDASPFEQRMVSSFSPGDSRDVLVVFRSPNIRSIPAKGYKVWWSCDQYTVGGFANFAKSVNKIVTISPYHQKYFETAYGITGTVVTDLPVRDDFFPSLDGIERIKNRFLFSTVPDRGLDVLWRMWPAIMQRVPDASLVVTSDYRLWGAGDALNGRYKVRWVARSGVDFLGAVPRKRLLEEQQAASVMLYHSLYDELFCISVAEAQCAGVYTVTNGKGALMTTNMGTIINWENANDAHGDRLFVDALVSLLNDPEFEERRLCLQKKAKDRFSQDRIVDFWEEKILNENTGID